MQHDIDVEFPLGWSEVGDGVVGAVWPLPRRSGEPLGVPELRGGRRQPPLGLVRVGEKQAEPVVETQMVERGQLLGRHGHAPESRSQLGYPRDLGTIEPNGLRQDGTAIAHRLRLASPTYCSRSQVSSGDQSLAGVSATGVEDSGRSVRTKVSAFSGVTLAASSGREDWVAYSG